ncbi:MAG: glycosyltransferase [Candidatus Gastranaerophilaceae bacterium]
MPKVSILVPIYNVEKYLVECLDSLINQTLEDIEIICINDGSTDSSPEILKEYAQKDSRIKVINKDNSGYGASMNMGLAAATGEYIGILESDDFVKTTMYEVLYSMAINNNLDVAKADCYLYWSSNKRAIPVGKIKRKLSGKVINVKDDTSILKISPSIWSAIYRREFLINNGIKFLETPGASYQDIGFAFKVLCSAERIMLTHKCYLYYRQDNENSSVKSKGKVYCICDEWDSITDFLNTKPEIKSVVNDMKLSTQYNAYKSNAVRVDTPFKDEFIERFQATFKQYVDNNEITEGFYRKCTKKEFNTLLTDKQGYRKFIDDIERKERKAEERRKQFSIKINPSRVSIVLFGKQIVRLG